MTVTRREDATFAPNGYIYNVYFDGAAQDATDVPMLEVGYASCEDESNAVTDETVTVVTVTQGSTAGGVSSASQLPLGDIDDSSLEGT